MTSPAALALAAKLAEDFRNAPPEKIEQARRILFGRPSHQSSIPTAKAS